MRKCCKSDILKELERDLAVDELEETDETTLTVINFMVLVRMICTETSKYNTFGDLSDALLKSVTRVCSNMARMSMLSMIAMTSKIPFKALKEFDGGKCECKKSKFSVKAHHYLNKEANSFLIPRTSKISATLFLMIRQSRQDDFWKKMKNWLYLEASKTDKQHYKSRGIVKLTLMPWDLTMKKNVCPCFTCHGIIFTRKSYYMEHW